MFLFPGETNLCISLTSHTPLPPRPLTSLPPLMRMFRVTITLVLTITLQSRTFIKQGFKALIVIGLNEIFVLRAIHLIQVVKSFENIFISLNQCLLKNNTYLNMYLFICFYLFILILSFKLIFN